MLFAGLGMRLESHVASVSTVVCASAPDAARLTQQSQDVWEPGAVIVEDEIRPSSSTRNASTGPHRSVKTKLVLAAAAGIVLSASYLGYRIFRDRRFLGPAAASYAEARHRLMRQNKAARSERSQPRPGNFLPG